MEEKRTLTVLQEDIDNGVRGMTSACAVALAVKREWLTDRVGVGRMSVNWIEDGVEYTALLPEEAQQLIFGFDSGLPVESCKFEVTVRLQDPEHPAGVGAI